MARWKPGASPEFLDPYKAEPVSGLVHLHGQRAGRMVHVGAADAPVTLAQIRDAIGECRNIKQSKLDILGWEWEMPADRTPFSFLWLWPQGDIPHRSRVLNLSEVRL